MFLCIYPKSFPLIQNEINYVFCPPHHLKNYFHANVNIFLNLFENFHCWYHSQSFLQPPKKQHINYKEYQEKMKEKKAAKEDDKEKVCVKFCL